jgi:isoquinoline 1-oxidoreductase subunit alpha
MQLKVNGQAHTIPPEWREERLLWVLREHLGLVGAKYGCGLGQCGACTVLLDGAAVRSCMLPVQAAEGRELTTVEGLATGERLHPVQQAWVGESVPQCGYCQPGHVMAIVALLRQMPRATPQQVEEALAGHLCRCGTQDRMRRAAARAAGAS